jgi:DNA invertase Pin-like site-specific DNA recombinase
MVAFLSAKITEAHVRRQALIYVRQSTLLQVRHHTGSAARQYQLQQRAQDLGWPAASIQVIDQDQGHSGATATSRDGFQWVVAEVGLGHVGAVFCLEASRLARSCSDWYRLLEICALAQTLVIDEEGIYDPGFYNDRLLLGFKGTMSEAELHWLRQRLDGGKWAKAQQGVLRHPLPVGLVYDLAGTIVPDPDEQVANALALVFQTFARCRSALGVTRHFRRQEIVFPARVRGTGELRWQVLTHSRVRELLHNPFYAGAYVYGRLQKTGDMARGNPGAASRKTLQPHEWPVVLLQHHRGYISWEQYLRNREQLTQNCTHGCDARRGAARAGAALLQGLLHCGTCGRRMRVHYPNRRDQPVYVCNYRRLRFGEATCQTRKGTDLDQAVVACFFQALEPAHVELALAALEQIEVEIQQLDRQWHFQLERADYATQLARRRYLSVDPENRLVARSLEHEWNACLETEHRLQQDYTLWQQSHRAQSPLTEQDRQQILHLAQDVPTLWTSPTLSQTERKQLLRFLIQKVMLHKTAGGREVDICWQTQAHTRVFLADPLLSCDKYRTDPHLVDQIRHLARTQTDRQMCMLLCQQGWKNAHGLPLTPARIRGLRRDYGIATGSPERPMAVGQPQRADERYCVRAVAQLLHLDPSTVHDWCKAGRLDWVQPTPGGPRWIRLNPGDIERLRGSVHRRQPSVRPALPTDLSHDVCERGAL